MVERGNFGAEAEQAAVAFLEGKGFRIEARNFRCRYGELDIVAEDDQTLCFVEVRMRSLALFGQPAESVIGQKQRRVVKAALHYLFIHPRPRKMLRFDVIAVLGRGNEARV